MPMPPQNSTTFMSDPLGSLSSPAPGEPWRGSRAPVHGSDPPRHSDPQAEGVDSSEWGMSEDLEPRQRDHQPCSPVANVSQLLGGLNAQGPTPEMQRRSLRSRNAVVDQA